MLLAIFSLRSKALAAAAIFCLLHFRLALAGNPVNNQCPVFSFRITDIRCDDDVEFRYHIEFEVLNWSNAFSGGVKLQLASFSDSGIEFVSGATDPDGRPLMWEDIDGDLDFEYDSEDLEDTNANGILDNGEDVNGNSRLDNDPIPGNFGRPNSWSVASETPTSLEWSLGPNGTAIPFINLEDSSNCAECIAGMPDRGGPQLSSIGTKVNPVEYVDNGDNVQDGFVMTIDGMEPGKVAHINWFLLGAGGARTTPEDTPSGDCREGAPDVDLGKPIGTVGGGNDYGFGLISLFRLADRRLPGGLFSGQTGVAQTPSEFFDSVYNVPPATSGKFPECGKFAMEFAPGLSCPPADADREETCPPDKLPIPGEPRSLQVMPVIDGKVTDEEWAGAMVIPLWEDSNDDGSKPSLSTAYVKVNCVTRKWYIRTKINPEEGTTHMMNLPEDQYVEIGGSGDEGPFGFVRVDGNTKQFPKDGRYDHFEWVFEENAEGEQIRVGWEACLQWEGRGGDFGPQPNNLKIHTRVGTNSTDLDDEDGEESGILGSGPDNMVPVCVCDGSTEVRDGGFVCFPIQTKCGGDPHFSTWSGEKFTFDGECDLVLIRNPAFADGAGMHVHARTKIRGGGWSDMESVAIRIGGDVFEARGAREYWINGERNARLPALVGGYQVSLQHVNALRGRLVYVVHLGGEKELRIKAFDEMMWVQIKGQQSGVFEGSDGLLGNFGNNGQMMGRDGATVIKIADDYGQEWQVRPDLGDPVLFKTVEGPQYPQKCKMPVRSNLRSINNNINNNAKGLLMGDDEGVRLAIAKKACARAPKEEVDDCIYDVVATRNVNVAQAY